MSVFLNRQKVKRRKTWSKWVRFTERSLFSLTIVLGGLALLYGFYLLVAFGPFFPVQNVLVEGNLSRLSRQEIIELSGIKMGQRLFGIDVDLVYKKLKKNPWVNHAAVRRRLPNTVWIYVDEHEPVAIFQKEDGLYHVDKEGIIFKRVEPIDPKGFPVITGVSETNVEEALTLMKRYLESPFGQTWGIAEIHLDDSENMFIITEKGPIQIITEQNALASQLDLLSRWQGVMLRRPERITYIIAKDKKKLTVGYGGPINASSLVASRSQDSEF